MVPSWWKHRRVARRLQPEAATDKPAAMPATAPEPAIEYPPRDGL
jgi:hypothetical protein